jgi:hypothetical protein
VPEAAVDVDRDPRRPEHDVGAAPKARQRSPVHPVPQPRCMKQPPQRQLRLRVSRALHLHAAPHTRAAGIRGSLAAVSPLPGQQSRPTARGLGQLASPSAPSQSARLDNRPDLMCACACAWPPSSALRGRRSLLATVRGMWTPICGCGRQAGRWFGVWEHEDPAEAAERVRALVLTRPRQGSRATEGR